jgi:hypothetical protein
VTKLYKYPLIAWKPRANALINSNIIYFLVFCHKKPELFMKTLAIKTCRGFSRLKSQIGVKVYLENINIKHQKITLLLYFDVQKQRKIAL